MARTRAFGAGRPSLPTGRVFVALNGNTVAVPYGAFGATTYGANAFAEAAVDLTALTGEGDLPSAPAANQAAGAPKAPAGSVIKQAFDRTVAFLKG